MVTNEKIKEFSIQELFRFNENDKYLIPIYQRNYAWTKTEVEQLVMDINDYSNKNSDSIYYIGTLVVFEKEVDGKKVFETIDGQQRLTTISILLSVLKNEYKDDMLKFNHLLKYESREISTDTLKYIYEGNLEVENLNSAMENAYKTIKNYLKNNITAIDRFKTYLLDNVKILRVNVPKDTDLNHYFEIMNNRGEQLEKHEVLKARMLKELDAEDKKIFNNIWEACSDMSRYVQYGFSPGKRKGIFGENWNSFVWSDFDSLKPGLKNQEVGDGDNATSDLTECDFSIDAIISNECNIEITNEKKDDDTPDRFTSPVNFSNFLLHVLKVTKNKSITLDDKGLLDAFKDIDEAFVKEFGFNLLKLRFLLDNYVIKRAYTSNKDEWSLKQAYTYNKQTSTQHKNIFVDEKLNKQILMILSMFHVSNPSQIYKYWLTGALNYLFKNYGKDEFSPKNYLDYLDYLEQLAKQFFFNRYLAKEPQEFDGIIFNKININSDIDTAKLNQGTSVEHFIFNYLDYLLWKQDTSKYSYYSFAFSNSVEHFYPQNPIGGNEKGLEESLDSFGNLCLISVSKNAKLNNHPPQSKKAYYSNNKYDSLKQHIMMEKADNWDKASIEDHKTAMLKVLGITNDPL